MGMKRKAEKGSIVAKEDKTPNANSEKTNVKDSVVIKNKGISNSKNSPPNESQSDVTDVLVRRSGRLITSASHAGRKPVVEHVNVVENERKEAPQIQLYIPMPFLRERNLKEEVPQIQPIFPAPPAKEKKLDYLVRAIDEIMFKDKKPSDNSETTIVEQKPNGFNAVNIKNKGVSNSKKSKPNKSKSNVTDVVHKRTSRVINSASHSGSKPVVEYINNIESEEKEAPQVQQDNPMPFINERNLEEEAPQIQPICTVPPSNLEQKVDYLVQTVNEFRPKVFETRREDFVADFSYKSLFIDSQKQVEALLEEKNQLLRKLEFANGKIEAYEKMKEVIVIPSLGNYINPPRTEHITPIAAGNHVTSPAPKKKKLPKQKVASVERMPSSSLE